jgi:hypothetical protein
MHSPQKRADEHSTQYSGFFEGKTKSLQIMQQIIFDPSLSKISSKS